MGLIKDNYVSKTLGITVPHAYAIVKNVSTDGPIGRATFIVQSSRENAFNYRPLDEFEIEFEVNRNESPFITAYNAAKGSTTETVVEWDAQQNQYVTHDRTVEGVFYGWEDDIEE